MDIARWVAVIISLMLVIASLAIMIAERTITAEAWALLLLAPIPAGLAITNGNAIENSTTEILEWPDESELDTERSVGDPSEEGFDVPVL